MTRIRDAAALDGARVAGLAKLLPAGPRIGVGTGTCGVGNGAEAVLHAFASAIDARGAPVRLASLGCFGYCAEEPIVNVWAPGQPLLMLHRVQPNHVDAILDALAHGGVPPRELILCRIEEWDHLTGLVRYGSGYPDVPDWHDVPFFKGQHKVVLRNCGLISPDDIEEYIAVGGYQALQEVLRNGSPATVTEQIKAAKLRGRGGAGYLTGVKWDCLRTSPGPDKFVICNADEGDPGAYMNRNEIESDPHALLEGMAIGGYAMGASHGIVYVRAEYPLAVRRLEQAVDQARACGLLGEDVLGSRFCFDVELVEGAGAFVCGEETALIASLEDAAGRPRPRPPYPAEQGLFGKPTNINNVETWYNVAPIVTKGPAWFTGIGSPKSAGTKVFSLVGKVARTGLVELPLGTPLARFVYDIGGGAANGRSVKAVQTGGPSGGCVPAEMLETPVDYESLAELGSIMGSGGMVVMDEDNCMVDVARYFIEFTRSESCGKCVPCRVGLDQAFRMLNRFSDGTAPLADIDRLDELCRMVRDTSLCGLGQTAPNAVLTTLRHFRDEFEDHVRARRCRAGVCESLALSPCENSCPLHMNIPRFLALYEEGRVEDALLSVILDNPLPASTGRVCQHPCEDRCRRAGLDEAVNVRDVHRTIADTLWPTSSFDDVVRRLLGCRKPPTGHTVAVVGAGPAGLTCAYYLALLGHAVTVYESRGEAGGMLRYALPGYRLPKEVLAREVALIERVGVQFQCGVQVGRDVSLDDLGRDHDAVFLSIGTWAENTIKLPGADLSGVVSALPFLEAVAQGHPPTVGARTVVIGGGNSAIDSARTARRLGSEATVVYRRARQDMPAIAEEVEAAEREGVRILFLASPHRVLGDKQGHVRGIEVARTTLGEFDTSGRRRPVPTGEVLRLDCTTVILGVGEGVDPAFARGSGLKLRDDGTVDADRYSLETSRRGFFAGGDLVAGPTNVSNAMGFGKQAARSIDRRLTGERRFASLWPAFLYAMEPPVPVDGSRRVPRERPAEERVGTCDEVSLGLSELAATGEAARCLRCDIKEVLACPRG